MTPRPGYVLVYDQHSPTRRREVRRREPELTCFCGATLKVRDDRCTYLPCGSCNATFYVVTHEGPYMAEVDE